MNKLIIVLMLFASTAMFSQETFKERKQKQALTFQEQFKAADLSIKQGKKYISFKKEYDKNIKIMKKHIDSFYMKKINKKNYGKFSTK